MWNTDMTLSGPKARLIHTHLMPFKKITAGKMLYPNLVYKQNPEETRILPNTHSRESHGSMGPRTLSARVQCM